MLLFPGEREREKEKKRGIPVPPTRRPGADPLDLAKI